MAGAAGAGVEDWGGPETKMLIGQFKSSRKKIVLNILEQVPGKLKSLVNKYKNAAITRNLLKKVCNLNNRSKYC